MLLLIISAKSQQELWAEGSQLYSSARYAEAAQDFRDLLAQNPSAGPALGLLGLCEFEMASYSDALTHIQQSIESGGVHDQPRLEEILRFHEALLLTRSGHFDRALSRYGWFASKGIKTDAVFAAIGVAALRVASLPAEVAKDRVGMYVVTGKVVYAKLAGDSTDADEGMRWLLQQFPSAPNLHYLYGTFLMGTDPDAAMDQFRAEIQSNGSSAAAEAMLAWTLMNIGENEKALIQAQQAIQSDAGNALARYVLGETQVSAGQTEAGVKNLQIAGSADPKDLKVHIALAKAFWLAARPQDAQRERDISIQLAKESDAPASTANTGVQ